MADKIPDTNTNVLVSRDGKKARVNSRVLDLGADEQIPSTVPALCNCINPTKQI